MRSAKVPAFILLMLAASLILVTPGTSSDAAPAASSDVVLRSHSFQIDANAGSSTDFMIVAVNKLPKMPDNITNTRMVSFTFDSIWEITATVSDSDRDIVLAGQEFRSIPVHVEVYKYATADTYTLEITLTIVSLDDGTTAETAPVPVYVQVLSPLSADHEYNKIIGLFKNPLPEPFNGPISTAVISFLIWVLVGLLLMVVLIPFLVKVLSRNDEESSRKIRRSLRALIPVVVLLFAFDNALRVYGTAEEILGPIETWFHVIYVALGAIIAWRVYVIVIQQMLSKIAKTKRIDQKEMDIEPLLRLLGKLVLWVLAVAMIMSILGFNLTAIITSAGIISLGITLGAQSILNQFFSGMVLLTTRPFKSGDIIRVDNSPLYRVQSVNIMNTVFENWENEETVIMPNNAVSSATIVNLTGEGLIYKINVVVNVGYGDDIDLAKELMEKAATDHPNVINNDSVSLPYTRVTAFLDSSVEIRLTSYVYDFNDSSKIGGELREAIFKAFKENGISIPFPQRDVRVTVVGKDDIYDADSS
ncbi:MAG: mechanosensitive ion channel family protein [Methanomassiliicoccaceae archaeon]|nr:mechanosensitive ion channel family protein [Methanomassiliicoccaceae archaeon]